MKRPVVGWRIYRAYRRAGMWLARYLTRRFKVVSTVLDTNIPNVPFLKVVSITTINGYGQEYTWRRDSA